MFRSYCFWTFQEAQVKNRLGFKTPKAWHKIFELSQFAVAWGLALLGNTTQLSPTCIQEENGLVVFRLPS